MSNPDDAAAQTESFADQVAKAITESKQDKDGKDILPEGLNDGVSYAVVGVEILNTLPPAGTLIAY